MPLDMLPRVETSPAPELPFWHILQTDSPEKKALKFAYALIADKKNWCTGAHARNKIGTSVDAKEPHAARFCAYGALKRAEEVLSLPAKTARRAKPFGLTYVNDFVGHRATLRRLEKAILQP